ncbi:uncharacterized protein MYCGRDRAFT_90712 [Zymoseptoria tritici IPO323]|uniref:Major facilitator superfamily (MFS) profile domain-containing protein n=1 Tax=Zymoseptoria tritici (strain CBS 115943 / IPO323) TaxID=336722 RepID=F9X2C0_ZYMTI|nr:uncharacterized protein MYCGRDRAFT_90712 [Zymoseptoria tritici IPO323]EGP90550.1 hypothetical protein MYCGRDRAFT_90712 [Zymoseptoria tritici IPO323]
MSQGCGVERVDFRGDLAVGGEHEGLIRLGDKDFKQEERQHAPWAPLLALPSFRSKFDMFNPKTKAYALPSNVSAAMNSIPFAGQALGALLSSFAIDWFGNLTGSWEQLTFGRFLAYIATELAEMAVIHFNGEGLRYRDSLQGLIPVAVQFIPAVLILIFIWFTVESPRWLIVKGRRDDALASLNRLRPKEDAAKGLTSVEIDAIVQSLEEQGGQDQGRWVEIFQGNMLRRTWICCTLFALLQSTGIQWTNFFAATYYIWIENQFLHLRGHRQRTSDRFMRLPDWNI